MFGSKEYVFRYSLLVFLMLAYRVFCFLFGAFVIFVCFSVMVFPIFLPGFFGGYDVRRWFLVFCVGFVSIFCSVFGCLFNLRLVVLCVLFLVVFFCVYYFCVELWMYVFFVLSVIFGGAVVESLRVGRCYSCFFISVSSFSCLLYGFMAIDLYLFALFDGVLKISEYLPWGFANIRYWSHLATWLLPLLPLAVLVGPLKEHRLWRWGVTLGAGLWWWMVFLSTARGSMVAVLIGSFLSMVLIGRTGLAWFRVLCFHVLVGGFFWLILSVIVPSIFLGDVYLRPIKLDGSGRWPLFLEAWHMSLENFPFGMGPQSWLTHDIMTEEYAASLKFGHPHNMYLMWAAEYGWLLVFVMGVVGVRVAIYLLRARNRAILASDSKKLLLLTGFTASVGAAFTHAAVSAVFIAPASMLIGLFVLIGFWALILPGPDGEKSGEVLSDRTIKFRRILGVVFALILATAWTTWVQEVWTYYQEMREDEKNYYETGAVRKQPRFWLHGNFPR